MKSPEEESDPDSSSDAPSGIGRGGGALLIWILAAANGLLAAGAYAFTRFLAGAENYLLNGSAEFGADLQASQAGIFVMRIVCYGLIAGFLMAGVGIVSRTRAGYMVQLLWAGILCLTLAGLLYGIPAIILLRVRSVRGRFFPGRLTVA